MPAEPSREGVLDVVSITRCLIEENVQNPCMEAVREPQQRDKRAKEILVVGNVHKRPLSLNVVWNVNRVARENGPGQS